jgi:hypothetical protein
MMNRFAIGAAVMAVAFGVTVGAQKVTPLKAGSGGSAHERVEWTVDGAKISIEYGRPSLKGRTPGKDIDPFEGKEWRTGADEQTTLKTDKALKFGSLAVPAGTYGLHTIPVNGTWQLIISKRASGWGIPYPAGQDLGRVPMTMSKPAKAAEQLTISVDDTPAGGALNVEWGGTKATAPFTVG